MPVPWLRILDAVIGVTDLARSRKIRQMSDGQPQLEGGGRALDGLETRLAGVVVAALREAFDRDARRLELERQQFETERLRAERALKLALLGQAADREIGRLRLIAGVAVAGWIGTLFFVSRQVATGVAARATLGAGWVLLLAATAASLVGQSHVARRLQRATDDSKAPRETVSSGAAGALAIWLTVAGLALIGVTVFVAKAAT